MTEEQATAKLEYSVSLSSDMVKHRIDEMELILISNWEERALNLEFVFQFNEPAIGLQFSGGFRGGDGGDASPPPA